MARPDSSMVLLVTKRNTYASFESSGCGKNEFQTWPSSCRISVARARKFSPRLEGDDSLVNRCSPFSAMRAAAASPAVRRMRLSPAELPARSVHSRPMLCSAATRSLSLRSPFRTCCSHRYDGLAVSSALTLSSSSRSWSSHPAHSYFLISDGSRQRTFATAESSAFWRNVSKCGLMSSSGHRLRRKCTTRASRPARPPNSAATTG
mmetsp:Transcript_5457/g.17656  ORF Transcript_5457/g.17656 Transcript_5457/m.17656 type:complete len:206 (-) Transcript_5457:705-1322(-)